MNLELYEYLHYFSKMQVPARSMILSFLDKDNEEVGTEKTTTARQ